MTEQEYADSLLAIDNIRLAEIKLAELEHGNNPELRSIAIRVAQTKYHYSQRRLEIQYSNKDINTDPQ